MQQPVWKRLMWLAIIWGGSVLALACVSMLFKMLMAAAGFKSHYLADRARRRPVPSRTFR